MICNLGDPMSLRHPGYPDRHFFILFQYEFAFYSVKFMHSIVCAYFCRKIACMCVCMCVCICVCVCVFVCTSSCLCVCIIGRERETERKEKRGKKEKMCVCVCPSRILDAVSVWLWLQWVLVCALLQIHACKSYVGYINEWDISQQVYMSIKTHKVSHDTHRVIHDTHEVSQGYRPYKWWTDAANSRVFESCRVH